jgi:hypothetical protein
MRTSLPARRVTLTFAGLIALAGMILALAIAGTRDSHASIAGTRDSHASDTATPGAVAGMASMPGMQTDKAVAFHDATRGLWETHGAWTHMVIVSFVGNLPNLAAEEQVLLRNQVDIGNAVKPYYGAAAGNKLTKLLKAHILGAVTVLEAAKSGDSHKLAQSEAAWSANGRQIADFLHAADPRFLTRSAARRMMQIHLEQVIQQAVDELKGNYAADAHAYGPYIRHILDMADMISGGIIRQFPGRFS